MHKTGASDRNQTSYKTECLVPELTPISDEGLLGPRWMFGYKLHVSYSTGMMVVPLSADLTAADVPEI
jgi:hypothetical protein